MKTNGQLASSLESWPVIGPVVRLFSSVWFGIGLMVAIFVYASIASAGILYPTSWDLFESDTWERFLVRARFDKTEMEAFAWWPFNLLILVFGISLVVVTLRRIKFNLINLGVWMIHTGILILTAGSVYYFSTKVEGDTPVFRRRAIISVPSLAQSGSLVIYPGSQLIMGTGDRRYEFAVANVMPEWPLLTGEDKGKKAFTAQINVKTPTQQFIRQVHAGYPQYTEDVIPGQGRAVKATGKALVDESLEIRLEFDPQDSFFVMDSGALFVRREGSADWKQRRLRDLPHYHERIGSREEVWWPDAVLDPIDLVAGPEEHDDPLVGYDVRVTGFLPYATMVTQWVEGSDRLNPVVSVTLRDQAGGQQNYDLAALSPSLNSAGEDRLHFRWIESPEVVARLAESNPDRLRIKVPGTDVNLTVDLPSPIPQEPEPTFVDITGTDYAYRVRNVAKGLPAMAESMRGRTLDVAIVEIRRGEQVFTRMVASPAEATRDMSADHEMQASDRGIEMIFEPGVDLSPGVTIVAGPDPVGLHVLFPEGGPMVRHQQAAFGQPVPLTEDISLTVNSLVTRAQQDIRPQVVPVAQRDTGAGQFYSMVKLVASRGSWSKSVWLPFNPYALPSEQYAGRLRYATEHLHLPDGQLVEVMFSRERMPLPAPVVLDDFELLTHTGGFSGSNLTVRDFVSRVRFATPDSADGWTPPTKVASNHPAHFGGFWFFQSTWDPPAGSGYAGMHYTGLGVGNRNGVHIQLVGTIIAVLGMIYAFYVKPVLVRRRREASRVVAESRVPELVRERADAVLVR